MNPKEWKKKKQKQKSEKQKKKQKKKKKMNLDPFVESDGFFNIEEYQQN